MKLHKLILAAAVAAIITPSCSEEPEMPPMVLPEAADLDKVNTTLLDLKTAYWSTERNYVKVIGLTEGGEHIYVKGRVVSSDASGNVYKSVVIDDGTAALAMAINDYDLYETYQFGQEVVIDMTGLKLGGYNSLMQLGGEGTYNGAPSMTFMEPELFAEHAQQNGLANPSKVDTTTVTIADMAVAKSTAAGLIEWQSRLIRIDEVSFVDAGQAYAPSATTDRYVVDKTGARINVRCSSYASFAKDIIPSGTGSVVGILSYYGSDWQILMIDAASAVGFKPAQPGDGDGDDDEPVEGEGDGSQDKPYSVAQVIALGNPGSTAWVKGFIVGSSNGMNASDFTTEAGANASNTNIFIADSKDETDYTKCVPVQLPAGSVRAALSINANPGNLGKEVSVYGSLVKYFQTTGVKETSEFVLEGGDQPSDPVTPIDPVTELDCGFTGVTAISQLAGWTSLTPKGNKAWYFTSFENNEYAAITAYKGTSTDGYEAWLITPALNVDGMTDKVFSFDSQAAYTGNDRLEVFVMSSADPATATLTAITDAHIAEAPAQGYSGFEPSGEVSLASFSGVVYIGFRYTADNGTNFHTYCIDNVVAGKKAN